MKLIKNFLLSIILAISLFVLSVTKISAQVVINSFYSSSSPDWVEVKNSGNSEIEITNYQLEDTSASSSVIYKWQEKTYLPALGSCVVEVSNRLNNDGDTIYLKDSSGNQIDCALYGTGNGGTCSNIKETSTSSKPSSNCYSPTPTPNPTSTPTNSPTPSPTSTATAVPTKSPTPKPSPTKSPTPKPSPTDEASPTPFEEVLTTTPPELLGLSTESSPSSEPLVQGDRKLNFPVIAILLIVSGFVCVGVPIIWSFRSKSRYNNSTSENS